MLEGVYQRERTVWRTNGLLINMCSFKSRIYSIMKNNNTIYEAWAIRDETLNWFRMFFYFLDARISLKLRLLRLEFYRGRDFGLHIYEHKSNHTLQEIHNDLTEHYLIIIVNKTIYMYIYIYNLIKKGFGLHSYVLY